MVQSVRKLLSTAATSLGLSRVEALTKTPEKLLEYIIKEGGLSKAAAAELAEAVEEKDSEAVEKILSEIGGEAPAGGKKTEAPGGRRGGKTPPPEEEEEEAEEEEEPPARGRRGGKTKEEEAPARGRRGAAAETKEEEAPARRGRRGAAAEEPKEEEAPTRRGGRRGSAPAEDAPAEDAPSGRRGRRGSPPEKGEEKSDGSSALTGVLERMVTIEVELSTVGTAVNALGEGAKEYDEKFAKIGAALAFLANEVFGLKGEDALEDVLSLEGTLEEYIDGGN
jgi:hypothetical protein